MADTGEKKVGKIIGAESREVGKGKVIYEIDFSDGETYTTWKHPVFKAAQDARGMRVTADVTVQEKGDFTNYYWNGFETIEGEVADTNGNEPEVAQNYNEFETEPLYYDKNLSIERQCIVKATAVRFAGLPMTLEALDLEREYMLERIKFVRTGNFGADETEE